jgi:hypothetical protein
VLDEFVILIPAKWPMFAVLPVIKLSIAMTDGLPPAIDQLNAIPKSRPHR